MSNVMFTMNQFKKNSNEKGNTIYIEGGPGKGLSNNMWAIATAIYYRENYGMNIMLRETDSILFGTSNKFGRKTYKIENGKILSYKDTFFKKLMFYTGDVKEQVDILHNDFTNNKPIPRRSVMVRGFCANMNLFHSIHNKIPNYLHLHDESTIQYIRNKYENIENGIMIGIRRGPDGGFKKITQESYKNALERLKSMDIDISNLFILTDVTDAWANIIGLESKYPAIEIREDDYTQFIAGMMCQHFIITESSYHWWIAYMGIIDHPIKKVLYFDESDLTRRDLTMKDWIKIK